MSRSSSKLRHGSLSGFRKASDGKVPLSSERTKRDIGPADDVNGQEAPELADGVLLADRYLVLRRLGRGGFSDVYLAHDHELDRPVAIKRLLLSDVDPHFIKDEAKTLASLDHPGIVRIYDICRDAQHGYLVIMQYVAGPLLRDVLAKSLSINRAVEIAIRICGGLIHAHSRGVVHRDIKPTNILMSNEGEPLIADFGLALAPLAHCEPEGGTPRYMSPEQIRNETKRIGPSSDIFSTGVLLYEMLAGRVPFNGPTAEAISRSTLEQSPTPINEINADVPVELDRIVRRALRKNVKDRYCSMEAFQAELIRWLNSSDTSEELSTLRISEWERSRSLDSTFASSTFSSLGQFTHRGLQPFESDDAKFFLSLVPGSRAPSGLPESVQYWKDWIESFDGSEYSRIGILYGPSGSGKTSLLRAGIVPYLAPDLLPISIECRKGETVAHYSAQISQQVGIEDLDLAVLLLKLRDEPAARNEHRKVVLLFDQFDSWAGSTTTAQLTELAAALRHCDGESLQALVVVRDDFWTSATEFIRLVECGVEQWKNARSIELFDRHHARRLLEAAGRVFGSLPPHPEALSADQAAFINQAIDEMSVKGRVLPIQLAMFAKIAKLQSWHPDTLSQAGGVQGTYVGYFQDLFESPASPPIYQRVCSAVVEVLHCLIPNADQTAQSHQVEFGELESYLVDKKLQNQLHRALNILVEDLRIVVRISHRGSESATEYAVQCNDRFHLVHDFLAVPIANWVDQVRKSSWRGRAIARLEELSAMWNRKQHPRFLPTLPEFVAMQIATPPEKRNAEHRSFLRSAGRKHFLRMLVALAFITPVCIAAVFGVREHQRNLETHTRHVVSRVGSAICGETQDFVGLLRDVSKDKHLILHASRTWEDSPIEKQRMRTRLLHAAIHESSFGRLVRDLNLVEPQLSKQFIEIARHNKDAKALLQDVFYKTQNLDKHVTERVRAAVSLGCLGDLEPLVELFSDSNDVPHCNLYFDRALEWEADPKLWIDIVKANRSPEATYYAICMLGSFQKTELPKGMPWKGIAALQGDPDIGVSMAAKWFIEKTPSRKERVAACDSPRCRILPCGVTQVRIEDGESQRFVSAVNVTLSQPRIRVDNAYWLSCAPVTNAEFEIYLKECADGDPSKVVQRTSQRSPLRELHPQRPVTGLNAIDAALYCNWLSRKAGFAPAYEILPPPPQVESSRIRMIEGANGFRFPSISQIAYAAEFGLMTSAIANKAQVAIKAFRKSKGLDLNMEDLDRYAVARDSRTLMPNRAGLHFDFDSYDCWAVADSLDNKRICNIGLTPTGYVVHARDDTQSFPFATLWLTLDCQDSDD